MKYPFTKKVDVVDDYHGTKVADPYRWLEDLNSEETKKWLGGQNALTEKYFSKIQNRGEIRKNVEKYYDFDRYAPAGLVAKAGDMMFFRKGTGLEDTSKLIMQNGIDGKEEVLVDPKDYYDVYTQVYAIDVSCDCKYLIFGLNKHGSDWMELRIMEIETRKVLPEVINWTKGNAVFHGEGFFYTCHGKMEEGQETSGQQKSISVKYHKLFTQVESDAVVFGHQDVLPDEKMPELEASFIFFQIVDKKYLAVSVLQFGQSIYIKKIDDGKSRYEKLIWADPAQELSHRGNTSGKIIFSIDEKLMAVDPENPDKSNWKTIIDEQKHHLYFSMALEKNIFAVLLRDGVPVLGQFNIDGALERIYEDTDNSVCYCMADRTNRADGLVFVDKNTFGVPPHFYLLDPQTGKTEMVKSPKGRIDTFQIATTKKMYASKDGTMVPITLFHKPGVKLDGKNPTLLYGYGGFGLINFPQYSVTLTSFVQMGGVYAIAGIRGGGEFGKQWHVNGCLDKKQNSFDDFIAAGEWLIEQNYTDREHLAILGGSNGGTLVGACINQRPDLFAVAISVIGIYDKLRYHKFSVGRAFIRENGCSDNPEQFKWLYAYSPLHNVKPGTNYPATLIVTNSHDNRCPPLHSFKFVSALQDAQSSDNPVLLKYQENGGHGAKATKDLIGETTDILTFIFANIGFEPKFV